MTKGLLNQNDNLSSNRILHAWSDYISKGTLDQNNVRPEVIQSWKRSMGYSVNPHQDKVNRILSYNHLKKIRDENELLLSIAEPKMKALAKSLYGTDAVVTLADKNGVIFNTFGDTDILVKSEGIGLVPGSIWNEKVAGTNAVGVALSRKKPIQILYSEHFSKGWHNWSSNASPILHPITKELIGVFDIAGLFKDVNRHTLELAISKTNQIASLIMGQVHRYSITKNPFLNTTLQSINSAMLIIDTNKSIIKVNPIMQSLIKQEGINNLLDINEINEMIDHLFQHKQPFIENDITMLNSNSRYTCKILPVFIENNISGAIIHLEKLNHNIKLVQQSSGAKYNFNELIGDSDALKKQITLAKKAAQIDFTLFLSGESGTGKEMFAQSVHNSSKRRNGPFIAVNCGSIPKDLIESELFGYESGSFTGADSKGKKGKFEQANGGTIFLDEIGDMPLNVQVQLLRVLEESVITRIGSQKSTRLDFRIIAATHKDLKVEVKQGRFRSDLYYRIHGIHISLPPLRERGQDILQLAQYFIKDLSPSFNKTNISLSHEASLLLLKYTWPGNLRELKNVIQQTLFKLDGNVILANHLPAEINSKSTKDDSEKDRIIEAIKNEKGHMSHAANSLNISRATLYRKLKYYQLTKQFILNGENDS